ncbi:MAG: hypothetical protein GXP62_14885 [Oligoflexia bacterium]|nr:hypothetical protein [Oligoflexia bacterium]
MALNLALNLALAGCASTSAQPLLPQPAGHTTAPSTQAASVSATSVQRNTDGFHAYQSGDLSEAARLFRESIALDDKNALAHYNLACTLALLRRQRPPCETGATQAEILAHLTRAVDLDEGRRTRMRADSDLDDLHALLGYRLLDQGLPASDADLRTLLSGVTLWAPASGIYGSTGSLVLRADGGATVTRRVLQDDALVDQAQPDGRWSVRDGAIRLDLAEGMQQLHLDPSGALMDGDTAVWLGTLSECSA